MTNQPNEARAIPHEPVAYLHTLHMEGGQIYTRLSYKEESAFGEPGKDHSEEYKVTVTPLFSTIATQPREERHPGWTEEGHKWLDAGAPLGSTASPAKDGEGRDMGCTEEDFLAAIHEKTPNGEWISVQHHPNGDWSVAAEPDATPSLLDKAEAALRKFEIGDWVKKRTGASWRGNVVGFYSTKLTPIGYCVESDSETGSVQIYPESALTFANPLTEIERERGK